MVKLFRRRLVKWLFKRIDVAEFYGSFPTGLGTNYGPMDKYRDFRLVFFGSDAGRRVYQQIMDLCEGRPPTPQDMESHTELVRRAERRNVGLEIAAISNIEPMVEQQERALNVRPDS